MQKSGKATQICNFFWILSAVRIRFHLNFLFRAFFGFGFSIEYKTVNTSSAVVSRGEEEVGDVAAAATAAPAAAPTTPMLQKLFWSSV